MCPNAHFEVRNLNFFLGFYFCIIGECLKFCSFYHTCVRRKMILSTLYGWRNTNPSGFNKCISCVTWETGCHFRYLKCNSHGLLLHLWMLKTFAHQSCVDWSSRKKYHRRETLVQVTSWHLIEFLWQRQKWKCCSAWQLFFLLR